VYLSYAQEKNYNPKNEKTTAAVWLVPEKRDA